MALHPPNEPMTLGWMECSRISRNLRIVSVDGVKSESAQENSEIADAGELIGMYTYDQTTIKTK